MLRYSSCRWYSHLVRKVDPRGYLGNYSRLPAVLDDMGKKHLRRVMQTSDNVLFCGGANTGKLSLLTQIGSHLENKHGLKVAYVSADGARANRMGGLLLHHFIGLRLTKDGLPSQEQLEGTFDRHVRLIQSSFGSCIPSLADVDVLVLDSVEKIAPPVLYAMEAVARRVKGKEKRPFGGLRVIAAANFWELPVTPSSDTGGYVYQLDQWQAWFPVQTLLKHTYGQEEALTSLVERAQFGILTEEDIQKLEKQHDSGSSGGNGSSSPSKKKEKHGIQQKHKQGSRASTEERITIPLISNLEAITQKAVRFPKQRAVKVMPDKFRVLKQTDVGNFLVNMLIQSSAPVSYGLVDALSLEVGDPVHLLFDSEKPLPVGAGDVGEVVQVEPHCISVHFIEKDVTVDINRMRIECYHPDFPEVVFELRQFPLFPREKLCPLTMRVHPHAYHVNINGLQLTDTNDLGCLLSRMRRFSDFTLKNTAAYASLDNMVHEPTRIYYHQLLKKPISTAPEHWCRNCKSFVPTSSFFEHWSHCVKSLRWCQECDKTVPLELLEPHQEKHQLVLCLDCGQAVEWRFWDEHRLCCPMMMREVSPLNEFLPLRTRQIALELGLDKRDLHTMKSISRANLPKSKHLDHKYKPKAS